MTKQFNLGDLYVDLHTSKSDDEYGFRLRYQRWGAWAHRIKEYVGNHSLTDIECFEHWQHYAEDVFQFDLAIGNQFVEISVEDAERFLPKVILEERAVDRKSATRIKKQAKDGASERSELRQLENAYRKINQHDSVYFTEFPFLDALTSLDVFCKLLKESKYKNVFLTVEFDNEELSKALNLIQVGIQLGKEQLEAELQNLIASNDLGWWECFYRLELFWRPIEWAQTVANAVCTEIATPISQVVYSDEDREDFEKRFKLEYRAALLLHFARARSELPAKTKSAQADLVKGFFKTSETNSDYSRIRKMARYKYLLATDKAAIEQATNCCKLGNLDPRTGGWLESFVLEQVQTKEPHV